MSMDSWTICTCRDIIRVFHDYTGRGQLKEIRDGGNGAFASFTYDPNGNMTKRQAHWWSTNSTNMQYDELNRPTVVEQTGWGDGPFARSHQRYNAINRLSVTWRDEWGSKGEKFTYDPYGQLNTAVYNADQVWTGYPVNATRSVTYNNDALNRQSVSESLPFSYYGLTATYYDDIDLTGKTVRRIDSNVDFNWGYGPPDASMDPDWFSARWEGQVVPAYSETYTFSTYADDGVRLWVNGQLLIDDWRYHPPEEHSGTITLVAGPAL